MIRDALEYLSHRLAERGRVEFHKHPELPSKVLVRRGDEHEWEDVEAPQRMARVETLGDVEAYLKKNGKAPQVFVDAVGVTAYLDAGERAEWVQMPFVKSKRMALLEQIEAGGGLSLTQKDAVKLLRFDLHGDRTANLLAALSRIDFTRSSTGSRTVEHGKESLGRSVEAKVQKADQIPEHVDIDLVPFANLGLRGFQTTVRLGVYLDMDTERIELKPLSDELQRGEASVVSSIADKLAELMGETPVFHGSPWCMNTASGAIELVEED